MTSRSSIIPSAWQLIQSVSGYAAQSDRQPEPRPRFLAETDAHDLMHHLDQYKQGGGDAGTYLLSTWRGNVRWARNLISSSGEDENNRVLVLRSIRGAHSPTVVTNEITDTALVAALRKTERLLQFVPETPESELVHQVQLEPELTPALFSESTYQLDASQRATAARQLAQSAMDAGMLSAGYIEVTARSQAFLTSWGTAVYNQYTWARFSVTVRDPEGTGSGWAGVDWPDWTKIDGAHLSAIALQKCLASRHPVTVEPGRYTTILEPQAAGDLVGHMVGIEGGDAFRSGNYTNGDAVFNRVPGIGSRDDPGRSRLGERVVDERISITVDPMDPELGFPVFNWWPTNQDPWSLLQTRIAQPATWIKEGVLTQLSYDRQDAIFNHGENLGRPDLGAFRVSVTGTTSTIEEMIATTTRGLLVTRFDSIVIVDYRSVLCRGYTRDGLWLIEHGKISKPVTNLVFTESPLFVLNNLEQVGAPQRIFHPPGRNWWNNPQPEIVPALKVRDFSFTALSSAV